MGLQDPHSGKRNDSHESPSNFHMCGPIAHKHTKYRNAIKKKKPCTCPHAHLTHISDLYSAWLCLSPCFITLSSAAPVCWSPIFRHRLVRLLSLLQNCLKQTGRGWGSPLWLISGASLLSTLTCPLWHHPNCHISVPLTFLPWRC